MVIMNPTSSELDPGLIKAYSKISPSTIGHMTDSGFLKGLISLNGIKLVGCAVTVRIPHLDSCAVQIAASILRPHDVLVVDMSGDIERASVGGIIAYAVSRRGAAGIVVNGCITDISEIRALHLPVYSRGTSPLTTRNLGIEGEINVPIAVAGAVVFPGDLIFGDENGVMVLHRDQDNLMNLAKTVLEKEETEILTKKRLDAGELIMDLSGAVHHLAKRGE